MCRDHFLWFIETKVLTGIRIIANIYLSFIMLAPVPSTLYTLTHLILTITHGQVLLIFLLSRWEHWSTKKAELQSMIDVSFICRLSFTYMHIFSVPYLLVFSQLWCLHRILLILRRVWKPTTWIHKSLKKKMWFQKQGFLFLGTVSFSSNIPGRSSLDKWS